MPTPTAGYVNSAGTYVPPSGSNPSNGNPVNGAVDFSSLNTWLPNGQITPKNTYSPITTASQGSSSGFTSSAQPIINQQTGAGLANGMGAVNGSPQGGTSQPGTTITTDNGNGQSTTSTLDPVMSVFNNYSNQVANILGQTTQNQTNAATGVYNATMQNAQLANQQIALQYNTGLGQLNTQYAQAFQQLQTQHAQSIGSAVAAIAAADPQGMQGGSFASTYTGKINDLYSQQSSFLSAAYGQQQQALANGDMEATLGIQQQINTAQATFGQTLASIQQGAMSTLLQLGQTGLGIAQFEQSRELQSQSQFGMFLRSTDLSGINTKGSTEDILSQLPADIVKTGRAAGMTDDQIASSASTQTIQQGKLGISQQYLGLEQMKLLNFQQVSGQINNLGAAPTDATGLQSYNSQILNLSGNSITRPDDGTTKALTTLQNTTSALTGLSNYVNDISNTSGIANAIGTFFGPLSTTAKSFNSAVTAVSGEIDSSLGTSISGKVTSMLSAASTPEARKNVINYIQQQVSQNGINTLTNSARAGYNVSSYGGLLNSLYTMQSLSGTGSTQIGGAQFGITKPNGQ